MLRAPLLLLTLGFSSVAPRANGAELDVYVLAGQSNALGTTGLETGAIGPDEHAADARTRLFWSNVRSTNTAYPPSLYGDSGGVRRVDVQQGDGGLNPTFWGPEFGFARALHEASGSAQEVLIIKVTRGGGGNGLWDPATFAANADAGHMWGHLRDTLDIALDSVVQEGHTFQLRGLLYIQGESNSSAEAAVADARLDDLCVAVRNHVHTQYPGTANNFEAVIGEIAASSSSPARELTTLRQMWLAALNPAYAFVRTADQPLKSDGIHFGRDAKLAIGRRLAEPFLQVARVHPITQYDARVGRPSSADEVASPVAVGFAEVGAGPGVTLDGSFASGRPGWRVHDDSSASNPGYFRGLGAVDYLDMFVTDWCFSAHVRVDAGGGLALWSVTEDDDPGWGVDQGAGNMNGFVVQRVNGDELSVGVFGQAVGAVQLGPGSADEAHRLELRGTAGSATYSLWIDGVQHHAGLDLTAAGGLSGFQDRLLFNSGSTSGTGRDVSWHAVGLTTNQMTLP